LEVAIDKYLSLALIRESGLPVPETMVCQTVPESVRAFQTLGQDVVIKPVFGGEGRGLIRVTDTELALRCFRAIVNVQGVVFLQRFVDSGQQDMRWLVIGDRLIGMLRRNPSDWRTNASRGAKCEPLPANAGLEQLASDAAKAVGTVIAGVDIIEDQQGQPWVLEVNGIPGWQKIGETCDVDVAAWVLECMESWVLDPKHPKTRGDSPVKRRPEDLTGE
jgi:ribosomal protein S6--L-glutamate ligase